VRRSCTARRPPGAGSAPGCAHPLPTSGAAAGAWTFRSVDLDIAGHVNNAAYWEPLEEELLDGPEPARIDAEIEFRTPCLPGVKQFVRNGSRRWILGDGEAHASLFVAELVAADGSAAGAAPGMGSGARPDLAPNAAADI
jgi:hypothetical protein